MWYSKTVDEALSALQVDPAHGLSDDEASSRLATIGHNELEERGIKSPWAILWEQLTAIMVVILIIAAAISFLLGETTDAIAILAIVVVNAVLGVRQEYKAEKAMAALKQLAVPSVRVRRSGALVSISARDLVPGDIVFLEAGSSIPADGRLVESANLQVEEAALTGESVPAEKEWAWQGQENTPLAERSNSVYMGTSVTYGRGMFVVTETGMRTELGKIATMIQSVDRSPTPLQVRLDNLGKVLAVVALILVGLIFVLGLWREGVSHLRELFLTSVSMAVAAVPEGLPAVVTIALALGGQRMLVRHALIRKLLAVEALGSVTVICTDKTGTLTENRMSVRSVVAGGKRFDLPVEPATLGQSPSLAIALSIGALCNDAQWTKAEANRKTKAIGDPTETALCEGAAELGLDKVRLEQAMPRIAEAPFDSVRKRMATLHKVTSDAPVRWLVSPGEPAPAYVTCVKGAVDGLLGVCDRILVDGAVHTIDQRHIDDTLRTNDALSSQGMRVLGFAYAPLNEPPQETTVGKLECHLVFAGLMALIDPPRPEVNDAVALCKTAGIRPIMITGDHPLTASHIGSELGLLEHGGKAVTGLELEAMNEDELRRSVGHSQVFARVAPESKLAIVDALQKNGEIVAMTGDGVNDAPALKKANIGVAMGITGTDVSKGASDMILLDDNFATIVAAVAEGRTIYDNIRKFIKYLMTTNSGELWVMIAAPFLGMPLPLLPLQILWMNLVTDGLPALALGVEPPERNVMRRPPSKSGESIFAHGLGIHVVWVGLLMAVIALGAGWYYWSHEAAGSNGATRWQTMTFTILTLSQMAHVLAIRSGRDSLFTTGIWSNRSLMLAVTATVLLQCALIYVPFLQKVFAMVPLSAFDMAVALALSSVVFWAVEAEKFVLRRTASQ
ncbi:MAG: cation-translocating P-type ATPase [Candidatus Hydrogenedentes bacterium]|nr:cation-translocating P-type ATPase [Candidatus Hydrogenedentota bacterium]